MAKESKKLRKLNRKLKKLDEELYNNKYVSREEFLKSKLSKSLKAYYKKLSDERKAHFLRYIIRDEDWETMQSLIQSRRVEDDDEEGVDNVPRSLKELNRLAATPKKTKKKKKDKRNVLRMKRGLLKVLNPESHDRALLSNKDYRKYLKKLADKEMKKDANVQLDCTIKNFREVLMDNDTVNTAVMDSFWNKHGY